MIDAKLLHGFAKSTEWQCAMQKSSALSSPSSKQANFASGGLAFKELLAQVETSANEIEASLSSSNIKQPDDNGWLGISVGDSNHKIHKADGEIGPVHACCVRVGNQWVSGSVFWSKNSTDDNPIMIVKGTDVDGSPLEVEVEIKNVNLKNASIIEMIALNGYLAEKGFEQPLPIIDRSSLSGEIVNPFTDGLTKYDFYTVLMDFLERQRFHKNWQSYTPVKAAIEALKTVIQV